MGKPKKVILVGSSGSGMSSIILRYIDGIFGSGPMEDFHLKAKLLRIGKQEIIVHIWDCYHSMVRDESIKAIWRNANGVVYVYDVSRYQTFEDLKKWIQEVMKNEVENNAVIVGNKCDLTSTVPFDEAQEFAKSHGYPLFLASALTGENLQAIFETIGEGFQEDSPSQPSSASKQDPPPLPANQKKECIVS